MSCIIEDNFTLKMFPLPNFKRRRKRLDSKNKNENNRYQLFSTRGKKLWGDETHASVDATSQNGERGGRVFTREKSCRPVDRSISRSGFDLPRDPAPLQRLLAHPLAINKAR